MRDIDLRDLAHRLRDGAEQLWSRARTWVRSFLMLDLDEVAVAPIEGEGSIAEQPAQGAVRSSWFASVDATGAAAETAWDPQEVSSTATAVAEVSGWSLDGDWSDGTEAREPVEAVAGLATPIPPVTVQAPTPIVEPLPARSPRRKPARKKAATKKASRSTPRKKASRKKAPRKKAPRKKAARSTPRKKTTRKATRKTMRKKTAGKKVAKKTSAGRKTRRPASTARSKVAKAARKKKTAGRTRRPR